MFFQDFGLVWAVYGCLLILLSVASALSFCGKGKKNEPEKNATPEGNAAAPGGVNQPPKSAAKPLVPASQKSDPIGNNLTASVSLEKNLLSTNIATQVTQAVGANEANEAKIMKKSAEAADTDSKMIKSTTITSKKEKMSKKMSVKGTVKKEGDGGEKEASQVGKVTQDPTKYGITEALENNTATKNDETAQDKSKKPVKGEPPKKEEKSKKEKPKEEKSKKEKPKEEKKGSKEGGEEATQDNTRKETKNAVAASRRVKGGQKDPKDASAKKQKDDPNENKTQDDDKITSTKATQQA